MIENQSGLDISNEIRFRLERSVAHTTKHSSIMNKVYISQAIFFYRKRLP